MKKAVAWISDEGQAFGADFTAATKTARVLWTMPEIPINIVKKAQEPTVAAEPLSPSAGADCVEQSGGSTGSANDNEPVYPLLVRWKSEPPRELDGAAAAAEYCCKSKKWVYRAVEKGVLVCQQDGNGGPLIFNTVHIDLDLLLPRLYSIALRKFSREERKKCFQLYFAATQGVRPTREEIIRHLIAIDVLPDAIGLLSSTK